MPKDKRKRKRLKSFHQLLIKDSPTKAKAFFHRWYNTIEKIVNGEHHKYALRKLPNSILCRGQHCEGVYDIEAQCWKKQLFSRATYKSFHLFFAIEEFLFGEQEEIDDFDKVVDENWENIREMIKKRLTTRHLCGRGIQKAQIYTEKTKSMVCCTVAHQQTASPNQGLEIKNEGDKAFHFFLNYVNDDKEFQKAVRMRALELFSKDKIMSKVYTQHMGFKLSQGNSSEEYSE